MGFFLIALVFVRRRAAFSPCEKDIFGACGTLFSPTKALFFIHFPLQNSALARARERERERKKEKRRKRRPRRADDDDDDDFVRRADVFFSSDRSLSFSRRFKVVEARREEAKSKPPPRRFFCCFVRLDDKDDGRGVVVVVARSKDNNDEGKV